MSAPWPYRFRAKVTHIRDADTIVFAADLGLKVTVELVVRLAGCNAAEKTTAAGQSAITFAARWLTQNADPDGWLAVTTQRNPGDEYGRWLGTVLSLDGARDLAADLIGAGLAVKWDGRGPKPVPA